MDASQGQFSADYGTGDFEEDKSQNRCSKCHKFCKNCKCRKKKKKQGKKEKKQEKTSNAVTLTPSSQVLHEITCSCCLLIKFREL